MSACRQELCENWSGDGNVCPCALFDVEPSGDYCDDCGSPMLGDVCEDCGAM